MNVLINYVYGVINQHLGYTKCVSLCIIVIMYW